VRQPEIEEWSSWDEDAPTSIKIEGGNGNVSPSAEDADNEPDYFKDMTPTIRKTQKVCQPAALTIQNAFQYRAASISFNYSNFNQYNEMLSSPFIQSFKAFMKCFFMLICIVCAWIDYIFNRCISPLSNISR
jgi:hypothetical protein